MLLNFYLLFVDRVSGVKASFGEMLLLIAIHFHSNQNAAIADLVSGTLGIKVCGYLVSGTLGIKVCGCLVH